MKMTGKELQLIKALLTFYPWATYIMVDYNNECIYAYEKNPELYKDDYWQIEDKGKSSALTLLCFSDLLKAFHNKEYPNLSNQTIISIQEALKAEENEYTITITQKQPITVKASDINTAFNIALKQSEWDFTATRPNMPPPEQTEIPDAPCNALDIAHYCVYYCSQKLKIPISNRQLQAILYYIQAKFLIEKNMPCFSEEIIASTSGPMIETVFYGLQHTFDDKTLVITNSPNMKHNATDEEKQQNIDLIEQICRLKIKKLNPVEINTPCQEDPWIDTETNYPITLEKIRQYFIQNPDILAEKDTR